MQSTTRMSAKTVSILGAFAILLSLLTVGTWHAPAARADSGCPTAAGSYAGGSGTLADPWQIDDSAGLQRLRDDSATGWDDAYILTADIDMGGCYWSRTIGDTNLAFTGRLDGDRHVVSGLTIGVITGATVEYAGLVGRLSSPGSLTQIGFTGEVLVMNVGSVVVAYAGGLVGRAESGTSISYSFATGDASGDASFRAEVGGLVGTSFGSVQDSYSTGDAAITQASERFVGGLTGYTTSSSIMTRTFAAGLPRSTGNLGEVGGFTGVRQNGSFTANFWDTSSSTKNSPYGFGFGTEDPVGRTTARMQSFATFDDSAWPIVNGWAPFDPAAGDVWGICEGSTYPFLLWQYTSNTRPCAARPSAPVIGSVTPESTTAAIAFNADDSGGATVTQLEFAIDDTTTVDDSTSTPSSPFTLTGLQPNTAYIVYMRSVNSVGTGPWSAGTAFSTTSATPPTPVPPTPATPPTNVAATPGDASIQVSWQSPASTGSYPVTQYLAKTSPGGRTCLTASTSCTIEGLSNGTAYTVTVQALTGAGWSPTSAPSNAVIPQAAAAKSIVITGTRTKAATRSIIEVRGSSTGLAGETVTMWVAFTGSSPAPGARTAVIGDNGAFTWSRRVNRTVTIYAEAAGVTSNTLTFKR